MNRLAFAGVILMVLLLGAVWWSLTGTRSSSNAALPVEKQTSAHDNVPHTNLPLEATSDVDQRDAMPPSAVETQPQPTAPNKPGPSAALELSGTIVVLDDQGIEHRTEDGHFQFVLLRGQRGNWHRVDVVAGRWSTSIPGGTELDGLGLAEIALGDRPAMPLEGAPDPLPLPSDQRLDLRVLWAMDSLLHVRDRASGIELDHVMLVDVGDWRVANFPHPGDAASQATDRGRSPIRLDVQSNANLRSGALFAASPGYAWGRIKIDERRGGERFLLLDPGGELEVQLIGTVDDPNAMLRLFGSDHKPVLEVNLAKRESVDLSGLLLGEYRLNAQIGNYWENPIDLGEMPALVIANQRNRVVLTLRGPAPSSRVPCAGTLVIPAEWERSDFVLSFDLLGTALGGGKGSFRISRSEMQGEGEPPTEFHWKAQDVQPGRYSVEVSELAYSVGLNVPPQGMLDARIEVPPPIMVAVRCIDDASAVEIKDARVDWRFQLPEGVRGWVSYPSDWNKELRCFEFRAPIGTVMVSAGAANYARISKEVAVGPGSNNTIELRLRKLCSLKPILRDGTTVIPLDHGTGIELEPAEGQESYSSMSSSGGSITLHRLQPGLYTLKIPNLHGYQPVPDQIVRLEPGILVEHVIQLNRVQ